jgi:hypothetical protein
MLAVGNFSSTSSRSASSPVSGTSIRIKKIDIIPAEERARTVKRFLKDLGWKTLAEILSAWMSDDE